MGALLGRKCHGFENVMFAPIRLTQNSVFKAGPLQEKRQILGCVQEMANRLEVSLDSERRETEKRF